MSASIFWYDYETTGIDPRADRALQVAGIRTDEQLNEIGQPLNLYCRLADDILPHPAACRITGIGPAVLAEQGLNEAQFIARLHAELAVPGTCTAGYNNLRFDDELTRYTLYRNFYDPYAREWQGNNSRWDLIDALRAAYALRPEGIIWPMDEEGRVSMRLERLTAANGIEHGQAHDALADVRATIAMARLLRDRQPRLHDYLYQLRRKFEVQKRIALLQPLLHVSGRFSAARHFIAAVLPLAWHPTNRNAVIVCDLQADPQPLLELDVETLRARLYQRRDSLPEGQLPVPLKLLHINRCPVLAPLNTLREQDAERLQLNRTQIGQQAERLIRQQSVWQEKLQQLYGSNDLAGSEDPEQQLYEGFLGERDRNLCEQVRLATPEQLSAGHWAFADARLPELLFRYRARNFPDSLNGDEQQRWKAFCRARLSHADCAAPNTLEGFEQALVQELQHADAAQQQLLQQWAEYVRQVRLRHGL